MRPIIAKSRNQSQSRESSEYGSHRSLKIVRVNGLKEAERPKLIVKEGMKQGQTHNNAR
jgi:hypothetical protein